LWWGREEKGLTQRAQRKTTEDIEKRGRDPKSTARNGCATRED
jgi:hypothetical protein